MRAEFKYINYSLTQEEGELVKAANQALANFKKATEQYTTAYAKAKTRSAALKAQDKMDAAKVPYDKALEALSRYRKFIK